MRVYAIGDVHGYSDKLRAAHARIEADRRRCRDTAAPVVHLGDYCDRGPDSAGVIQILIDGMAAGQPWRCLLGNHDRMFRDFLRDPTGGDPRLPAGYHWLRPNLGGTATLQSYGIGDVDGMALADLGARALHAVPPAHTGFLAGLEPCIETDALFLAHAGIRPGVPLAEQVEEDLIWIRHPFLDDTRDHGKLVVHGHTPVQTPMHFGNRVALDTRAAYGGPLTAAVFEGRDCWVLTDAGRVALLPES